MKTEKEVREYVAGLGGRIKKMRHNKHWVVTADFGGRDVWFTVPNTPSDRRSMQNNSKWILRQAKGKTK
jgi:hypothetical protein